MTVVVDLLMLGTGLILIMAGLGRITVTLNGRPSVVLAEVWRLAQLALGAFWILLAVHGLTR